MLAEPHFRPERGDIADFLVDNFLGQAEFRDLAADHAASSEIAVKDDTFITQNGQIAHHRHGGRSRAYKCNPFAVPLHWRNWHPASHIAFVISGNAFQAANCHRLFIDASASARRLARTIAGTAKDSGENIRLPVDHISVRITLSGDHADIFRDGSVGRARPLTIDHFMKVVGITDIRRQHATFLPPPELTHLSVSLLFADGAFAVACFAPPEDRLERILCHRKSVAAHSSAPLWLNGWKLSDLIESETQNHRDSRTAGPLELRGGAARLISLLHWTVY